MHTKRMPILPVVRRLLLFQVTRDEMLQVDIRHLAVGLLFTWLAGMGRVWDSGEAQLLQRLGVGSVVYVFILALLVWATAKPLSPLKISYFHVLTFICLTSPPALIYAIPVEKFLTTGTAHQVNVAFLVIVATWRVALLIFYLDRVMALRWFQITVATLLMLSTIIAPLTLLNLASQILTAMSGARDGHSPTDAASVVVTYLGVAAIFAFLPLLIVYGGMVKQQTMSNGGEKREVSEKQHQDDSEERRKAS